MIHPSLLRASRCCSLVLFGIGCLAAAGCSRPTASVTGKVTFQNKALKGGNVTFVSTEGYPSNSGMIGEDGTYSIPHLLAGNYKVTVETASLKPPISGAKGGQTGGGIPFKALDPSTPVPEGYKPSNPAEAQAAKNSKRFIPIPDQYSSPEKTTLTYTVSAGSQEINLDLK